MASRIDFQPIISNIVQPGLVDNVVNPTLDKFYEWFSKNTNIESGDKITDHNVVAKTANGGAFTRADANPASLTQDFATPWWYKTNYHEGAIVRREDIDQALAGSAIVDLLTNAANTATELLLGQHVYGGMMTQLKADVDSASTYSDAALTRVTVLQSYEDSTDATITLPTYRAAQHALSLKEEIMWQNYIWVNEQTVWNTGRGLMSETGSWVENNPRGGEGVATGYLSPSTFDGIRVDTMFGMTVGDAFLLNRGDVQIQNHKAYELEMVPVDEYAYKMVARIGVNLWVRRPAFQAKLANKD